MNDHIRNGHIGRTRLNVDKFGLKVRQSSCLGSWYGHVKSRNDDYVGCICKGNENGERQSGGI